MMPNEKKNSNELLAQAIQQAEAEEAAEKKKREAMRARDAEQSTEAKSEKAENQETETEATDNDIYHGARLSELLEDFDGYGEMIFRTEELFDLEYIDGRYCKNRTEALLFMMHESLVMIARELHYHNTHGVKIDEDTE